MDGHCLSPCACKCCMVFKQFDELNFDGSAGKHQKCQNSPCQNFLLYGTYFSRKLSKLGLIKLAFLTAYSCITSS